MADSAGIGHATQSLQDALRAAVTDTGPFAGTQVELRSPKEIGTPAGTTKILSLWLYRVRRFDELENAPPRIRSDGRIVRAPLPVVLHYLVTPLAADELTRHRLLGNAMQALHDQAQLGTEFLRPGLLGPDDGPVGIHFEQQSFEDATRVWHALQHPYQLSVSYLVQYVPLESLRSSARAPPVVETAGTYAAIEAAT
jgi:uncharacterized protein DUF4255